MPRVRYKAKLLLKSQGGEKESLEVRGAKVGRDLEGRRAFGKVT